MHDYGKHGASSARGRGWKKCLVLTAAMWSTGCATATSEILVCPEMVVYAPAFQVQAASELEQLPDDAALITLLEDYLQLRDRIRAACPR